MFVQHDYVLRGPYNRVCDYVKQQISTYYHAHRHYDLRQLLETSAPSDCFIITDDDRERLYDEIVYMTLSQSSRHQ